MATYLCATRCNPGQRECLKIAFRQAECLINSNTTAGKRKSLSGMLRLYYPFTDGLIGYAFSIGTALFLAGCDSKHIARSASVGSSKVQNF